jgi:hypothetical protein
MLDRVLVAYLLLGLLAVAGVYLGWRLHYNSRKRFEKRHFKNKKLPRDKRRG